MSVDLSSSPWPKKRSIDSTTSLVLAYHVPAQHNIRRAAHAALHAWGNGHDYAETLVERHAQRYQLSASDRGLLNAIIFGVLRHRRVLDAIISEMRRGKLDNDARDLLRIGLFQILILNIADHAAVNETVDAGKSNIRGLLNACLRRAAGQKAKLLEALDDLPPAELYSHPDWLYKRWRKHYGADAAIVLMQWNQEPAENYARYNPLSKQPCPLENPLPDTPGFYPIEGAVPMKLIRDGIIYMQDPATRHCVEMLSPTPGEIILDACAAPGGKAALIAAAMENQGTLVATDSNEKRLPRLRENLERLHITCAEISQHDWLEVAPDAWRQHFDGILLDVPCSNSGVLRRRVDARWRMLPKDLSDLPVVQRKILENAVPCVKSGGRIVYSTCSIEPEENSILIKRFLVDHPEFTLITEKQILPNVDQTDGAYCALLKKS
ncbi:MAG: 16S rRNA (cytosine(967)-C(5))-methyltransferase [Verrucomicrobiia bacterium Tous-C3TDCM]|nr:MAG: 16S rRNA (cytosine(967)-C(5))-methyltransferase [Verrucomicrobiae bacterium Tous-C3TDCM]PAZ05739.1 MAG: 16S rRNA (cytosine(967)-C(5))-methyltransferase [Verrucomicrobiae bacterium AMD-G2]